MSEDPQRWFRICDLDAIAEQEAAEFVVEGLIVAVFREQEQWYALDAMCAHQGGPIAKGTVANGCVTCPWHGWQYELATGRQTIHNQKLLETYPLKEQDGGLWIQLPDAPSP
ncbi:Rieske (2Fe-2S) protein [Roseimaritima ulvae]|uniref:Anthranilate 1,2-dioxygenase ferredoxin subunit n=1 Tax=Roseimaritima ulvae TaxID=980254 RepID=A0A5B9QXD3_9BACT|nr:Rieske (2Fe-2S) protein [Roseimaritima ulvae]QEG42025.1 Anthranilate 1,2-dioxygenase ferredoxin subunit [Roseimaritima ulvae]